MTVATFAISRWNGWACRHCTNAAVAALAAATRVAASPPKNNSTANVNTNDGGIVAETLGPDRGIANADTRMAASVRPQNSATLRRSTHQRSREGCPHRR